MTDYALNQDWRATALSRCGNQVLPSVGPANDWLPQVIADASTKGGQQNVDLPAIRINTWGATLTYYKMRGMDQLTGGVYATWVVSGQPDFTAARYVNTGGLNLPLRDICVVDIWTA